MYGKKLNLLNQKNGNNKTRSCYKTKVLTDKWKNEIFFNEIKKISLVSRFGILRFTTSYLVVWLLINSKSLLLEMVV